MGQALQLREDFHGPARCGLANKEDTIKKFTDRTVPAGLNLNTETCACSI